MYKILVLQTKYIVHMKTCLRQMYAIHSLHFWTNVSETRLFIQIKFLGC